MTEPDKTNAVLKIQLIGGGAATLFLTEGASNSVIRGLAISGCDDEPRCTGGSIHLSGGTGYKVEGNFVGSIQADGTPGGVFTTRGVFLDNISGSTIGGTTPDKRNIISGNREVGVPIENGSSRNKIQGNLIGTDKNGGAFGNDGGVMLDGSVNTGNSILSNSIFSHGTLGIDLNNDGVTPNDDKDPDTGPNRLQNYPDITSALILQDPLLDDTTNIGGELNSTPSTRKKKRTFIIQFFSSPSEDPSHFGEGKTFLGQIQVRTNRQGKAPISFSTTAASEGEFITATATNKRTGDTSEFSKAKIVEDIEDPGIGGG